MKDQVPKHPEALWRNPPDWELFHSNRTVWNAVLELCDAATHSIHIEQYIIGVRGIGSRLLNLLAAKARQGVDVQLVADGLGSLGLTRSDGGHALLRSGGQIAMFNGLRELAQSPIRRAPRLHRKTVICDGATMMVGGSCYHQRMASWRDTMIRIGGPLPPLVVREFDHIFSEARNRPAETPHPMASVGQVGWGYGLSGPYATGGFDLRAVLPEKIEQAETSVLLTTPYLLPNRRLWRALMSAVDRGA